MNNFSERFVSVLSSMYTIKLPENFSNIRSPETFIRLPEGLMAISKLDWTGLGSTEHDWTGFELRSTNFEPKVNPKDIIINSVLRTRVY